MIEQPDGNWSLGPVGWVNTPRFGGDGPSPPAPLRT